MNTDIIPKIRLEGSTTNEPLISFIQNYPWTTSNYCLLTSNGYTNLNGIIINGADNFNNIYVNNSNIKFGIDNNLDNNYFSFNINSNEKIRINSTGYLGINNINPQYHLDVNGTVNYSGAIYKNGNNLDNIYLNIRNNYWINDGKSNIYVNINSNINNIGIGTSIPLSTLHIGSTSSITNSDNSIMISKYDGTNNYNIKLGYDNSNFIIGNCNLSTNNWNKQLSINSAAPTNSLIIDNLGNIGINTNNPNNYKLNINGSLNASSIIGIGSNITQLNFNNITINKPDLSNLNNWISNVSTNTIYNNFLNNSANGIGIGTNNCSNQITTTIGNTSSTTTWIYKFRVNGAISCSSLSFGDCNISNIYLSSNAASSIYLNNNNYDWLNTYNPTTKISTISLKQTSNKLVLGDENTENANLNLCSIYGNLYAATIACDNASNILNIKYNNIVDVPNFLLNSVADTDYLKINDYINIYSNAFARNYTTTTYVTDKIAVVDNEVKALIGGSISDQLISTISGRLSTSTYKIEFRKVTASPINYYNYNTCNDYYVGYGDRVIGSDYNTNIVTNKCTFGFNADPDYNNSLNIITVGGNIISKNNIIALGNISENNSNLSNIYISSNVYNSNIIYYDKILDRKIAACTPYNYYPPQNYQYSSNYSNVVTNSPYGNGIYQIVTSTSKRGLEVQSPDGNNIQKSYQLFNTYNSSNSLPWQLIQSPVMGAYSDIYNNYYYGNDNGSLNVTIYNTSGTTNPISIFGHWVQYYYSQSFILNNIEFFVNSINNAPKKITVLATSDLNLNISPDNVFQWDVLLNDYTINSSSYINCRQYYNNGIYYPSNFSYCTIPLRTNINSYYFYRIIITQLINATNLILNQIKFNGIETKKEWKHSGNNIYSHSNISINTIDDISPYKLNVNGFIYSSSNIYANLNIGIGTTSPLANLHIGSTNSSSDGTIMISKFNNNNNINTNIKLGYDNNYNFIIGDYNSNLNIWNSQFIINSNASPNSLMIDANGNIGINTNINDPNFNLNVNGSTFIYNGIINQSNSQTSLTSYKNIFYNDIFASNNIISSNIITSNFTANYYSVFSNILSCLSNIGIGITNNFNGTLHINTNSNLTGIWNASSILETNKYISQFIGKNNSSRNGFYTNYNHIGDENLNNYLSFTTSNFYPILNLTANCNIGIGITNPVGLFQIGNGGKFTINKDDNSTALFGLNNYDSINNTKIFLNASNIEYYASANNGIHKFYTNNNENVRIDFNGNIGIGTTNTYNFKLNVNGNTFISSNLYLNSNIGIGTTNPNEKVHINNGSLLLNNFKFGNINNNTSNLIIGHSNLINNSSISQFIINSNASSNSIVISSNNYIGINNSNPIGNLHIGNINQNDSTLIISQNNRNFKIGYDNNYNFSFGDFENSSINPSLNTWKQQFYINSNATANSLIIDNNGNIGINTQTNDNNYKLNLNGNLIQIGSSSYNVFNGYVGIGTTTINDNSYKLNVYGNANITNNLKTNGIVNNGILKIGYSLTENSYPDCNVYISSQKTCINGAIIFTNSSFQYTGTDVIFNTSLMTINNTTVINSNLKVSNQIQENGDYLSNTYVKLANLSNLSVNNLNLKKKYGYLCTLPTNSSFNFNGINYYSCNIDLTKITKTNLIGSGNSNYNRLFNIKCFQAEDNFENFNSGFPNILQYDIYMSSNITSSLVNICAIGTPENNLLSNILPTNISILRSQANTDKFNNLSIVSPNNGIQICYITEDYLN